MTFSCPNFDQPNDFCMKLKKTCKLGQPGCVLEGKIVLATDRERERSKSRKPKPSK